MRLLKLRWFSVETVTTNRSRVEFSVIRSWKALAGCRCARGRCRAGLGEPVRSLVRSGLLRLRFMWVDLGGYRMHKRAVVARLPVSHKNPEKRSGRSEPCATRGNHWGCDELRGCARAGSGVPPNLYWTMTSPSPGLTPVL